MFCFFEYVFHLCHVLDFLSDFYLFYILGGRQSLPQKRLFYKGAYFFARYSADDVFRVFNAEHQERNIAVSAEGCRGHIHNP